VEDDLSAVGLGKRHPQDKDKFEGVVEGEPVDSVDSRLKDSQEGVDNPVGQPLSVVSLGSGEEGIKRVEGRDDESSNVDKELASNVEEDQGEVEDTETKDDVDLGNAGLLLKLVELRVLGELFVELGEVVLGPLLNGTRGVSLGRHGADGGVVDEVKLWS